MGGLITKGKRQKSSKETLEALQDGIQSLIQNRTKSQQCERSLVGSFIVAFLLLYPVLLVVGVVAWAWFNHLVSMEVSILYILVATLMPITFYGFKKLINMYFSHRKTQYDIALQTFQSEKKRVLNEVMDKEPYRVACELLEKYDPTHLALQSGSPNRTQPQENVRQRQRQTGPTFPNTPHPATKYKPPPPQNIPSTPQVIPPTPAPSSPPSLPPPASPTSNKEETIKHSPVTPSGPQISSTFIPPGYCLGSAPGPPVPVPILPRDRTNFDRVVEYILGDGPNNRYALICSACFSHNGMALKDDFEYLSFRCAYCYHMNVAQKTKPGLESPNVNPVLTTSSVMEGDIEEDGVSREKNEEENIVSELDKKNN